jgi:hypothetical protein
MGITVVAARRLSHKEVSHLLDGGVGLAVDDGSRPRLCWLRGIITLVSHMSRLSTIDKWQR